MRFQNGKTGYIPLAPLAAIALFALWGCLLIYTARAFGEQPGFFAGRQLLWLILGSIAFCGTAFVPFRYYEKYAGAIFGCVCAILVAVLFFGKKINGMTGWFALGNDIFIQPSEFAKGTVILYLSSIAGKNGWDKTKVRSFSALLLPALFVCALLLLEPDFGATVIMSGALLIVYFLAGGRLKFIALYLTGGVAASIVFVTMNPYALKRVLDFFAGKGGGKWHHEQFLYSLARGGWTGSSEGALWSNAYLPLPHTDSLYATIVESSGFIGGMIVLFLFLMIGFLFCRLAGRDGMSRCGKLYAGTVGLLCLVQALLHISVNLVILPTTGITLPFLSYGGSSLISTFAAFGIAFSAMRQGENPSDVESSATAGSHGDAAPEQGSGSA